MSKPGLAFGLNLGKTKPSASKPIPARKKPVFGDSDDSDNETPNAGTQAEEIGGDLDDFVTATTTEKPESRKATKSKAGPPTQPPKMKSKTQVSTMFGDLSSSLEARKKAEAAEELDSNIYEYDAVYDSLKPKEKITKEEAERKPMYMRSLIQAAEVRKRDALIAEEKKIAREREAEGDEFAGTEKFVTGAYKKQQEENRRIEEEEKLKAEEEGKTRKNGGMSAFYRNMLNEDAERHAEVVKATEEMAANGPKPEAEAEKGTEEEQRTEETFAKELNDKGASVALNEDGQVVDKRQLLRGGLNIGAKKKEAAQKESDRPKDQDRRATDGTQFARKQAMRERQSRMMAEQLEESTKRDREEEVAQREAMERSAKSRKTEGEISSAKERYLARKKAAEEAKKNGSAEAP